jgi:hypothetical protein
MGDFVTRRPCCNVPSLLPNGTIAMKKNYFSRVQNQVLMFLHCLLDEIGFAESSISCLALPLKLQRHEDAGIKKARHLIH